MNTAHRSRSRSWMLLAFGFGLICSLGGCNTIDGLGTDLREASQATQRAFSSDSSRDQPRTASTNDGTNPDR